MLPFEVNVSSRYGAPMGRHSDPIAELSGRVYVRRVPLVDGGYDEGGAYWGAAIGGVPPLFCAWDNEGRVHYFRAAHLADAKATLARQNPRIISYR